MNGQNFFYDVQQIINFLIALGLSLTFFLIAKSFIIGDSFAQRMKLIANERERIRKRERASMQSKDVSSIRQDTRMIFKRFVESFNLTKMIGQDDTKRRLALAGFRGAGSEYVFVFARIVTPIVMFFAALMWNFITYGSDQTIMMTLGTSIGAAALGVKLPDFYLGNLASKRQQSMTKAFSNALDLLLVCIEAGVSMEHAVARVADEIGKDSIALAEEFLIFTAELSYLPERRQAYENLAMRTGLEPMQNLTSVLYQAETLGTPLGSALRVMAQESRDARMNRAETKAAAMGPKLTVPMILFFLPGIFVTVMGPLAIEMFHLK